MLSLLIALLVTITLTTPAARADSRPSVCVMYFQNNTGDPALDPLQKGLADMLVTDLAGAPGLRVVERARLEEVIAELNLQRSQYVDPATVGQIGKIVGAANMVTGSVAALEPKIRIDVRMVSVTTGEVLVADKVVGDKDRFFELQEALASRFVGALGSSLGASRTGRVEQLSTVLQYSRALELADRGQLEAASKEFREVVTAAPTFSLAGQRYAEVLERLREAKAKREASLGQADVELFAKAERIIGELEPQVLAFTEETADQRALDRLVSYRILRGNLILGRLMRRAGGRPGEEDSVRVPAEARKDVMKLVEEYFDNQQAILAAYAQGRAVGLDANDGGTADRDDRERAERMGLGDDADETTFAEEQLTERNLGLFLCVGNPGFWTSVDLELSPAPAEMDARWMREATTLFDQALAHVEKYETNFLERETIRTLTENGDCLSARGQKMQAVARWQQILDTYPTTEQFDDVEKRIRTVLEAL